MLQKRNKRTNTAREGLRKPRFLCGCVHRKRLKGERGGVTTTVRLLRAKEIRLGRIQEEKRKVLEAEMAAKKKGGKTGKGEKGKINTLLRQGWWNWEPLQRRWGKMRSKKKAPAWSVNTSRKGTKCNVVGTKIGVGRHTSVSLPEKDYGQKKTCHGSRKKKGSPVIQLQKPKKSLGKKGFLLHT